MPTSRQISAGAAWMMLFKVFDKGIGFISTLILARLLMPEDFGIVAMATAVVALTQLMNSFGFDAALIQRQQVDRTHYDTAWTFNVLLGLGIAIVLLLLAKPTALFYNDPRLAQILPVIALGAAFSGFENIGTVAFRKELDFRSEFRFLLIKRLAPFALTIVLAVTLRNYWALVLGTLFGRAMGVAISFWIHPYRPRLTLAARHDLLGFSKWLFLSSLVSFLQTRSVDFIIGRTQGSHALGLYSVGAEIATLPSTELIAPINRAVYPAYAKLAADPAGLRSRVLDVYGTICMFSVPAAIYVFLGAQDLVNLLLGPRWLEAVTIVQIMTLSGLMHALQSNLFLILVSTGRPKVGTIVSASVLTFSLPAMVWSSTHHGLNGAAVVAATSNAATLIAVALAVTHYNSRVIRLGDVLGAMWRPALAAFSCVVVLSQVPAPVLAGWPHALASAMRLAVLAIEGAGLYLGGVLLLWWLAGRPPGPESRVTTLVQTKWRQWRIRT